MKKEDLIALGLDEETAKKVADAWTESIKGFIPKARFDEVNDANKQLKSDIASRDTQLEELKKTAGSSEELKKQIETLQTENTTKTTEYEAKIKKMQVDNAFKDELAALGITGDVKIKMVKALIELGENPELVDGKIKGLSDQLKTLQEGEETKSLFAGTTQRKGMKPQESGDPQTSIEDLQTQYDAALKAGDTTRVIMLKNQIFEEQNKQS